MPPMKPGLDRRILLGSICKQQTSLAPVVSSTWNSKMTSFFPCICVCETSAKDTSNACFEPTRKVSILPAKSKEDQFIHSIPENGSKRTKHDLPIKTKTKQNKTWSSQKNSWNAENLRHGKELNWTA